MENIFDLFETDQSKVKDGIEIKVAGVTFICRPSDTTNQFYNAELAAIHKRFAVELKTGTLSEEQSSDLMLRVFAKTVLIGWKNLKDRDGETIEYSEEAAFSLLKKMPKLHSFLNDYLRETKDFNAHKERAEIKN